MLFVRILIINFTMYSTRIQVVLGNIFLMVVKVFACLYVSILLI